MSKKHESPELDKTQRIKKHVRGHTRDIDNYTEKSLRPKHEPAKKQHVNILDAYEKLGDDYEDIFDE